MIRLEHFHEGAHDASRSIEFSSILSLRRCKHGEAIFVGAAKDVLAVTMLLHINVCEQVHYITKALLVHFRTSKVLGKDTLQTRILFFDETHGVVNLNTDLRSMCI